MKPKLQFISLLLLIITFLFFPRLAHADTFNLSGNVKDSSGNTISGATVAVNDAANDNTTTDSSGNYSLSIPSGTYNVQITPPLRGNFSSAIAMAQNITANTTLNFILAPSSTVTLSGHLYDSQGNLLTNQFIFLNSGNNTIAATSTDSSGAYSLQVSPGTYTLFMNNNVTNDQQNVAGAYSVRVNNYALTQSIIANFTLPMHKVSAHVQDASATAVSNVELTTSHSGGSGVNIGGGVTAALVNSGYDSPGPKTDASGNATLWLFNATYTFTSTPPSGSNYVTTTTTGVVVNGDTSKTITIQQPVTLSGHMYDALGNALSNQFIFLNNSSNNTVAATSTDANGAYSLQAAPGTYTLFMNNNVTNDPQNVAGTYSVRVNSFSLSQNKTLDITLPMKKITMHVQDVGGNGISGVQLTSNVGGSSGLNIGGGIANATGSSGYDSPVTTNASGNVTLWLFPSTFTFTATPPSGSNYGTATLSSLHITADTNLTMTMTQPVTLSGHLYDSLGNPLNNQFVYLSSGSTTIVSTSTNSSGAYSLQIASGTYNLNINNNVSNDSQNVSGDYSIKATSYLISQNTTLDITLPMKKVSVHIQDAIGNPVSGIQLTTTTGNANGLPIGGGITNATGSSTYGANSIAGHTTDNSGNITLWLLPANYGSFFATPPNGSIYSTLTLNNVSVTGDQTELISLQYNHATPVTTATLDTQHSDGTYSNPTTITLSATAAAGYTVANTYYTIDGGTQQTYTAPFEISNAGNHTIVYWSIDNSGVPEAHNTKNFTIYSNQAPYVNPISGGSVNVGQTYTENGSFTDGDSSSWTATVDYGEGAGPETLVINSDKTFALNHQYNTAGSYTVTIVVTDNQGATGTTMTTVNVNAPATINALSGTTISEGQTYTENGSFTDADSTSWTGKVNYGDGALDEPLTLNSDKTFTLNHQYKDNGTYNVIVSIIDNQGAVATQNTNITVNNLNPTVSTITVNATPVQINNPITVSATFTDQGILDTHTATWSWGDGSTTTGSVLELNGSGSVSDNHTYTTTGVYIVTLTLTDKDGGIGTNTYSYVAVYDPNGGFITGSGKITSPQGSMPQKPTVTGKSEFGIEAKYDNTNNPKGHIKFSFENGNIDFESISYDYVVVSGNTAYIIGHGKLNGVNAYTFLSSVIDGSPDKFRIKITDSNGLTIYDNQMNATDTTLPTISISSGNIKIH